MVSRTMRAIILILCAALAGCSSSQSMQERNAGTETQLVKLPVPPSTNKATVQVIAVPKVETNKPRSISLVCDAADPGDHVVATEFWQGSFSGKYTNSLLSTGKQSATFTNLPHAGRLYFTATNVNIFGQDSEGAPELTFTRFAAAVRLSAVGPCSVAPSVSGPWREMTNFLASYTNGSAGASALYVRGSPALFTNWTEALP